MHVPKRERVTRWLDACAQDLDAATTLLDAHPNLACYHAQQASEKALKAVITEVHGDAFPTHLAYVLLRALRDLGVAPPHEVEDAAASLDAYYLPTRYPDALDFADAARTYRRDDGERAIARALRVAEWARSRIETGA